MFTAELDRTVTGIDVGGLDHTVGELGVPVQVMVGIAKGGDAGREVGAEVEAKPGHAGNLQVGIATDGHGGAVSLVVVKGVELQTNSDRGGKIAKGCAAASMKFGVAHIGAAFFVDVANAQIQAPRGGNVGQTGLNALVADVEGEFRGVAAGRGQRAHEVKGRVWCHESDPAHYWLKSMVG